ncbi:MAG: hypothetical protein UH071_11180 [Paludibacteraceae bacterium]|nr:hypothetical protein [Paludibacteraceae bacterium]
MRKILTYWSSVSSYTQRDKRDKNNNDLPNCNTWKSSHIHAIDDIESMVYKASYDAKPKSTII